MPVFPPVAPVALRLDGRTLPAYVGAYVAGGRVYAAVWPLFTRVADRLWLDGRRLVMERDGRRAIVVLPRRAWMNLDATVVAAAAPLRALGAEVDYDPGARTLNVRLPRPSEVAPFVAGGAAPVAPREVFTPMPVPTPRPVWTGSPLPRRTPLPFPPAGLTGSAPPHGARPD